MTTECTSYEVNAVGERPSLRHRAAALLLPEDQTARRRLYITLAALLYCAAWMLGITRAHVRHTRIDFAVSDAVGYYVYLPTLVIDHDLRFHNQLETQFYDERIPSDIDWKKDAGWAVSDTRNRWPIGVALSVAPGFLVGHGLSLLLHGMTGSPVFAAHGYSILYFVFCLANAMILGAAAMICIDRLLTERFHINGRCAAAAVLTYWLGSNVIWFWLREPLVAHLASTSWVSFAVYLVHRIESSTRGREPTLSKWQLPLLAFATAMAVVCRFTNLFIFPLLAYLVVVIVRRGLLTAAVRQVPMIALALAPLLIQAWVLYVMNHQVVSGIPQNLGYREVERFYWTRPALILSLISTRRGLFTWTPVLLLSVWGWIWHLRRRQGWRDPMLVALGFSALVLWYVNACWYAWWFGTGAGNRAYVELAVVFVIGFGFAFTWFEDVASTAARRGAIALLIVGFLVNYAVVASKLVNKLEGNQPLWSWEKRALTGAWERF